MISLILGRGLLGNAIAALLKTQKEPFSQIGSKSRGEDLRFLSLDLENVSRVYFSAWDVGGSNYLHEKLTQAYQYEHNTMLLVNILSQLRRKKLDVVFVSTCMVNKIYSAYGLTKKLGEAWCLELDYKVVRITNIFGETADLKTRNHVITDFILQALTKKKIKMKTTENKTKRIIFNNQGNRAMIIIVVIFICKI